jgi:hypothetical protein
MPINFDWVSLAVVLLADFDFGLSTSNHLNEHPRRMMELGNKGVDGDGGHLASEQRHWTLKMKMK